MYEDQKININIKHWNKAFAYFDGWCALPTWGPFEAGKDDPNLIGDIKDKTFLEVCCGSGHSIKYLVKHGAKMVYGLDFSKEQLKIAEELNKEDVLLGKVKFLNQAMESEINLPEQVDTIFSIYGMPWTIDPEKTLKNIYNSLKPGGKFVWSWDHPVFKNSEIKNGEVVVKYDYKNENDFLIKSNSLKGSEYYISNRKVFTWFSLLRKTGFEINRYLEPEPVNLGEDISEISSPEMSEYYNLKKIDKLPFMMIFECVKPR